MTEAPIPDRRHIGREAESEDGREAKSAEGGPLLSVITVVYNNRAGLDDTARSVVSQTYPSWEWIVIDGGSTDGTAELIGEYAPHIAYWVSERDAGIYDAMNKGLRQARGAFVVFMNSGDRFAGPDALRLVADAIASAGPDVGIVVGGARWEVSESFGYFQPPRPIDYVRHSLPSSHQAMFFNTALHRLVEFNPAYRIAADYDAIARMVMINPKAAYVQDAIALVWRGMESNSQRFPIRNILDMAAVQRRVLRMSYPRIAASAVKRALPVLAYRLMANRWTRGPTARLIAMLRPETAARADDAKPSDAKPSDAKPCNAKA